VARRSSDGLIAIASYQGGTFPYTGGVSIFDGATWTHFTPENSPLTHWQVVAVEFDGNGNLWASAMSEGVVQIMTGEPTGTPKPTPTATPTVTPTPTPTTTPTATQTPTPARSQTVNASTARHRASDREFLKLAAGNSRRYGCQGLEFAFGDRSR
jgi:hypothetical protein